jgi:transposase
MSYLHFFGLDVSKGWFDVAIAGSTSRPKRFANSAEGIAAFLQEFTDQLPSSLVVLEATGGYETALIVALVTHKIAVHRAAPWQAHSFTRSLGKQAKTDGLDAKSLARMAAERHEACDCLSLPPGNRAN